MTPIYAMHCPSCPDLVVDLLSNEPPADGEHACERCDGPLQRKWNAAPSIGRGSSREPFRPSK